MDMANDTNGIVVGTGDLSEAALGWCTFGGDHIAMYGVNQSIPKTLMPCIINWVANNRKDYSTDYQTLKKTLKSVIETPISPELLPADEKGEIAQKTEESVGPYELHDYFIYHTMINHTAPLELLDSAQKAFAEVYDRSTIKKWLRLFYTRFFSQQFKRNCSTESPMVTQVSLSPRGGLTMPSDAMVTEWLKALN
jgi:NAD+ synthase (glutamine-hydrolysing)